MEKVAKEDERANRKSKEEEDTRAMAATAASASQKTRAIEGLQPTLARGVRVGLPKSGGKTDGN